MVPSPPLAGEGADRVCRHADSISPKGGLSPLLELVEEMQVVSRNRSLDLEARWQVQIRIDAGDSDLALSEPYREQLLVAELLGDHDGALERDLMVVPGRPQPNMLRAHAEANRAPDARAESGKAPRRKTELPPRAGQREMLALCRHVDGDEI